MNKLNLHRYIIGWSGLFLAFGITLPIAMIRVSQTEKFAAQPFNSLTCDGQVSGDRTVVRFYDCAQLKVDPTVKTSSLRPPTPR